MQIPSFAFVMDHNCFQLQLYCTTAGETRGPESLKSLLSGPFRVLPWYKGPSRTLTVYYGESRAGVSLWQRGGSEFRWEWSSYQHLWSASSLIGQWIPVGLPSLPTCHSLPNLLSCSPGSKQGQGCKSQSIPYNLLWSQAHLSYQRVDGPPVEVMVLCAATVCRSWFLIL